MAWDKTIPDNDELLINFPGLCRANWEAIETGTTSALQITNAKVSDGAGIVDTKLAQITTTGKVSGAALTSLGSIPAGAGDVPTVNLNNACKTTGNQTIAGIKTFSSFPVTPSSAPTTDYQAANKKYADDRKAECVQLTGNQSVAGIKTFSSFPVTPSANPTTDYQVANKKYVDDNVGQITRLLSNVKRQWSPVRAEASGPGERVALFVRRKSRPASRYASRS